MMSENSATLSEEVIEAARQVKLLLMDCDGVLTDGRLYFSAEGEVMKVFHVRDGQGIALWHAAGNESGIITGRGAAKILERRAAELEMKYVRVLSKDKSKDLDEVLSESGLTPEQVAFIGDDLGDIPILSRVGFPVAVGDAVHEVKRNSLYTTRLAGGNGAVREVIELLMTAKS